MTPLAPIAGTQLGVLLVTPAVALATPAVFAAFAAGARPAAPGAARLASEHLAAEMRAGIASRALLDRAAVLASANDLLPAALAVMPELVPFRRGLARVLGRPIGLSGSGPTCWAVYASRDEAASAAEAVMTAITDGRLAAPGTEAPFVQATTLEGGDPS